MTVKTTAKFFSLAQKKIQRVFLIRKKRIFQSLVGSTHQQKNILFVMGCQRSGTTMMLRIFERDMQSRVYGEFSKLSSIDPAKVRLNPLPLVKKEIEEDPASFVVLKPLVESQNLPSLLEYFSQAKALWMYRHYKDVASSNLKNFGIHNGIHDLRPIVEQQPNDWRSERVSDKTREIVLKYFSEDMPPLDAAALFWYVRNSLFFDLELQYNPRVRIFRYEDIVSEPIAKMREVYAFADRFFPGEIVSQDISATSIGKGKEVQLNPKIEEICQEMLEKLEGAYQKQYAVL